MRICRKCGAQVADGVMACPQCGAPMIEPPKTPQQDVEQNKVMAVLAYFGILVLIPILISNFAPVLYPFWAPAHLVPE